MHRILCISFWIIQLEPSVCILGKWTPFNLFSGHGKLTEIKTSFVTFNFCMYVSMQVFTAIIVGFNKTQLFRKKLDCLIKQLCTRFLPDLKISFSDLEFSNFFIIIVRSFLLLASNQWKCVNEIIQASIFLNTFKRSRVHLDRAKCC